MYCWGLIARQDNTQPSTHPALFGGVWNTALLKSAGRCRLVTQLIQWFRSTSVTVISSLSFPAVYNKSMESFFFLFFLFSLFLPRNNQQQRCEKCCFERLFCYSLYRPCNKKLKYFLYFFCSLQIVFPLVTKLI